MEKIINKLIDLSVKGCDVYHHKGSTWLIFTDTKQWVIELTEERTLWYNYNIFNSLFSYASMEVVENENYITKWVENNIINGIQDINYMKFYPNALIKNVVEKGIQEPLRVQDLTEGEVEEVIEFGVKETFDYMDQNVAEWQVDSIIKDGVRETFTSEMRNRLTAENIIENGVKLTKSSSIDLEPLTNLVIDNGVKETTPSGYLGSIEMDGKIVHQIESPKQNNDVIDNGIKKTGTGNLEQFGVGYSLWKAETVIKEGIKEINPMDGWVNTPRIVGDVIENGVKKTKTPNKDGDIQTTLEWMYDNNSDVCDVPKMIDNVIENGVKHTESNPFDFKDVIEDVVQNGVKETNHIKNNVRETKKFEEDISVTIDDVIENGVKETKVSDYCGDNAEFFITDQHLVDIVIENGVNKTHGVSKNLFWEIGDAIQNGVKKTISRENPSTMVDDIIKKTKADASQNPMGKVTEVFKRWKS